MGDQIGTDTKGQIAQYNEIKKCSQTPDYVGFYPHTRRANQTAPKEQDGRQGARESHPHLVTTPSMI